MIALAIHLTIIGCGLIIIFTKHQRDVMESLLYNLGVSLLVTSYIISHIWWFTLLGIYK